MLSQAADGRYTYRSGWPLCIQKRMAARHTRRLVQPPTASGMPLYIHKRMTAIYTEADDRYTYRSGWPLDIQKRIAAS